MTPIVESRSEARCPSTPMSVATTRAPTSAPASAFSATNSPATAPVKASSLVPWTAKDIVRVMTKGPMSPQLIATRKAASSACWANGSCR